MTRADIRELETKETNAFPELLKTKHHFFKTFDENLNEIKDPRHQSYIGYSIAQILYMPILKNIQVCNSSMSSTMSNIFSLSNILWMTLLLFVKEMGEN